MKRVTIKPKGDRWVIVEGKHESVFTYPSVSEALETVRTVYKKESIKILIERTDGNKKTV